MHKRCLDASEPNSFRPFVGWLPKSTDKLRARVILWKVSKKNSAGSPLFDLARSASGLEPQSIEARDRLRAALHNLGKVDEEEKTSEELANNDNLPPVRLRAYTNLVGMYDEKGDRPGSTHRRAQGRADFGSGRRAAGNL